MKYKIQYFSNNLSSRMLPILCMALVHSIANGTKEAVRSFTQCYQVLTSTKNKIAFNILTQMNKTCPFVATLLGVEGWEGTVGDQTTNAYFCTVCYNSSYCNLFIAVWIGKTFILFTIKVGLIHLGWIHQRCFKNYRPFTKYCSMESIRRRPTALN